MDNKQSPSYRDNDPRRRRPPQHGHQKKRKPIRQDVWFLRILLGAALALSLALALLIRGCGGKSAAPAATPAPVGIGSAYSVTTTAAPIRTAEGSLGRKVEVAGFQTDFTPPRSVTLGVLKSVDLTALGESVRSNAAATGWGEIVYSLGGNGELLLRNSTQIVLGGTDFERQEAFLTTDLPENLARTFLENSGLIPLLKGCGLTLDLAAERNKGLITFRGRGDAPGAECELSFSFLYTGAFNQAILRATALEGSLTTDRVLTLKKAADNAVTWSSEDRGKITVVEAELRQIHGLPFYVFTGSEGTVAYALAVEESVLASVPGAEELYHEMMQSGIQEYTEVSGAG